MNMKTKVLFFVLMISSSLFGLSAQNTQNRILERILHFDQLVQKIHNRQANQATIRLDSIVYKTYDAANSNYLLNSLQSFLYDSNDNNINDSYNIWDTANSALMTQGKTDYTYTSNGFIETETYYYFYPVTNTLIPSQKRTYAYNSDDQLVMMTTENYDVNTSSFINDSKETYFYQNTTDTKPNVVSIEQWDTAGSAWVLDQLGTITYNANFQFTDLIIQNRDLANSIWVNNMHFTRTYDSNSRLTQEIVKMWDNTASSWVNSTKNTFTYTASGTDTNILRKFFVFDVPSTNWLLQGKTKYVVDSNNNLLVQKYYYLDAVTNTMVGSNKMVYTYNGAQVVLEIFQWDTANSAWKTDAFNKSEYQYDNNIDKTDLILPFVYTNSNPINSIFSNGMPNYDNFHHKVLFKKDYSRATAADPWQEGFKTEYKYTTAVGIDEMAQIDVKVYPVPFDNYLKVQTKNDIYQIKILDLNGRVLYAGTHQNNERINLNNLTKGVYIYKIITGDGQATGQIIKN